MLPEKAVQPQKPGTVGLDGGRSMAGRRFPVQEQLHLWNEVQVRINQVPHASAVRSVSCDYLGRIHRSHLQRSFSKRTLVLVVFSHSDMLSRIEKRRQKGRQSEDVLFVVSLAYCSPKNEKGRYASEKEDGEGMAHAHFGGLVLAYLVSYVNRHVMIELFHNNPLEEYFIT
jgi:hypothetical protein